MSEQFIELMAAADKGRGTWVDHVVDTNVVLEMYSFGDLIRLGHECSDVEALRRSPTFQYRRHRAKHSIVLAHWFAKNRIRAASFGNEVIDLLTERLAPAADPFAYAVTTAILRVISPFALRGWCVDPLANVNHHAAGADADDEILRAALKYNLSIITWEGFTERGIVSNPKKLRDRCLAVKVPVSTPRSFWQHAVSTLIVKRGTSCSLAQRRFARRGLGVYLKEIASST